MPCIAFVVIGLSACGSTCDNYEREPLEIASTYPFSYETGYMLPLNTWVRNEKLEAELHKAVKADGIGRLTSYYQLQCLPHSTPTGCADCYACSRTVAKRHHVGSFSNIIMHCRSDGEMLIRADVGPGSTVSAMTYWKR